MSVDALITGVGGQDGAYLAARLLADGRRVLGTLRTHTPADPPWRLRELRIATHPQLQLCELDVRDAAACAELLARTQPRALFHLAAQSRVAGAFADPLGSAQVNALGTLHLLEGVRAQSPTTRFVFASSAEIFGDPPAHALDESAALHARHPYAVAKQFAHASTIAYRESFGLHAGCAILFNHESPLREASFVSRKIAAAVARLAQGEGEPLALGNLDAQRDYGYAPDYVAAMAAMAARDAAGDYVLATGVATSVREWATYAFAAAGIELQWRASGVDERAHARDDGRLLVRVDPQFFRPLDAGVLIGDAGKARAQLGFAPSVDVRELARLMVDAECRRLRPM